MKILFGSGNFIGSNIMCSRFIKNAIGHDIRVTAYYRNHRYLHCIDWCLDALYSTNIGDANYFKERHGIPGPYVNHEMSDLIINDLLEWGPHLVISDCEMFSAMVAKAMDIPLWYCSPMLQLNGIEHEHNEIKTKTMKSVQYMLNALPEGDKYLVYSPLCDIAGRPFLKTGSEWVRPYSEPPNEITSENIDTSIISKGIPEGSLVCTGETSLVSDCIYAEKPLFLSPNPNEPEQILNAQLLEWYRVAVNIGRPKSLSFTKRQAERLPLPSTKLSKQGFGFLDERLV